MRATHTFAELEVSPAAFEEITSALERAGYDHAFIDGAIDMHGIGLVCAPPPDPAQEPLPYLWGSAPQMQG